jgi:hypothetical protein
VSSLFLLGESFEDLAPLDRVLGDELFLWSFWTGYLIGIEVASCVGGLKKLF